MSWCLGFDGPRQGVPACAGDTPVVFMNSKLKILMGFNDRKCCIEFQLGRFQITPPPNWCVFFISWDIYTPRHKIFQLKKKKTLRIL